jgi:hypothetical protein
LVEADLMFLWHVAIKEVNSGFDIAGGEFSSLLVEVLPLRALGVDDEDADEDGFDVDEEEEDERLFER